VPGAAKGYYPCCPDGVDCAAKYGAFREYCTCAESAFPNNLQTCMPFQTVQPLNPKAMVTWCGTPA
jgi:hypothetical protein